MLNRFSQSAKLFGLTISLEKSEVLHQPAPGSKKTAPEINIASLKYLDSIISQGCTLDREVDARIGKVTQALGRVHNRVLSHHNVRLSTKLKVYSAVVIPSLNYGCESWTLYRRHI